MDDDFKKSEENEFKNQDSNNFHTNGINENITAVFIDKILNFLKTQHFMNLFEDNEKWIIKIGMYGLCLSALLGLIASIILPMRYNFSFGTSILFGIGWVLLCIVAHYTAFKFLPNIKTIINSTPTKLSSTAFLDSFSVIAGIGGVISLILGLYVWIKTSSADSFLYGLFTFIFSEYMLLLSLNPKILNIEITNSATAGEEFIGLFSFFMKSFLKLISIIFSLGMIISVVDIIGIMFTKYNYMFQITAQITQLSYVASTAFLPILGYVIFIVYYFIIDLASAIISIPHKIEELKK